MGDVVNLNRFRKQQERTRREAEAAENRVRFGRTKAGKLADQEARARAARALDGKRRDEPE